jgi:hypothetical protein
LVRAERLIGVILSPNLERLGLFLKRFSGIVIAGMKIKSIFVPAKEPLPGRSYKR